MFFDGITRPFPKGLVDSASGIWSEVVYSYIVIVTDRQTQLSFNYMYFVSGRWEPMRLNRKKD